MEIWSKSRIERPKDETGSRENVVQLGEDQKVGPTRNQGPEKSKRKGRKQENYAKLQDNE